MMIKTSLHKTLAVTLFLLSIPALAQDHPAVGTNDGAHLLANEKAAPAPVTEAVVAIRPAMSPAGDEAAGTRAGPDLAGTANAAMAAPGVCPVVDDLVRQFCAANPDDISCQFQ